MKEHSGYTCNHLWTGRQLIALFIVTCLVTAWIIR